MHVTGRKNGGCFRFSRSTHPSLYSLHHEYKATSLISAAAADRGCTRRGVYCRKWRALVIPLSGICNRLTYVYIRGFHGDKSTERSREESVPQRGGNPPRVCGGVAKLGKPRCGKRRNRGRGVALRTILQAATSTSGRACNIVPS